MTVQITDAVDGVPTRAECGCGSVWERPDYDTQAETLVVWGRRHVCTEGLSAVDRQEKERQARAAYYEPDDPEAQEQWGKL